MNNKLKVAVLTDTHYYSKKNYVDGDPYRYKQRNDQMYYLGSEEIVKAAFEEIIRDNGIEVVLVSGDLVLNADRSSQAEFSQLLRELKSNGKKVFVTTATHDYSDNGLTYGFDKDYKMVDVPAVYRDELPKLYSEFGFGDAVAYHEDSTSYVAQLSDGYRLLALNDDMDDPVCGFSDSCMEWIFEQLKKAGNDGQYMIAMTHHPMIAPSALYSIISPCNMLNDSDKRINQLAEAGLNLIFTGHSHIHNISCRKAECGAPFYDVSTAALTGFPPVYRVVTFDAAENTVDVSTKIMDNVKGIDTNGKSLSGFLKEDVFLGFISNIIDSVETDYENFVGTAFIEFSIDKSITRKYKKLIQKTVHFLKGLTYGKIYKVCKRESGLTKSELEPVRDKGIISFIIDVVSNLYKGNADYSPDTPEYKLSSGLFAVIDSVIRPFSPLLKKKFGISSIAELIMPLIYNDGIDDYDIALSPDKFPENRTVEQPRSFKGVVFYLLLILLLPLILFAGILVGAAFGVSKLLKK